MRWQIFDTFDRENEFYHVRYWINSIDVYDKQFIFVISFANCVSWLYENVLISMQLFSQIILFLF